MKLLSIVLILMGYQNEVPVKQLQQDIQSFFHEPVTIVYDRLPASAFYKARNRYRADSILNYLSKRYPGKRVVALTSVDISATTVKNQDWGVFGLASYKKDVCVTSTYRFKKNNLYDRTLKVMLHELGHTYDLPHCQSTDPCIMKAANHMISTIDQQPTLFCQKCSSKLPSKSNK